MFGVPIRLIYVRMCVYKCIFINEFRAFIVKGLTFDTKGAGVTIPTCESHMQLRGFKGKSSRDSERQIIRGKIE